MVFSAFVYAIFNVVWGLSMFQRSFLLLLIALLLASTSRRLQGQEYRATIIGTVTDVAKAVIPNAAVTVRNLNTNEVITVKTNGSGIYAVPYLHPGQKLEISAEAPGLKKMTYPPVVLSVSQRQTADFVLQVGSSNQEVTVN